MPASATIIITCGPNYGRWVSDAIASALGQNGQPEVVCVFDKCDPIEGIDQRAAVVRVDHGSLQLARRAGMAASTGAVVFFLDADNRYASSDFVSAAVDRLRAVTESDPRVAGLVPSIAYYNADWTTSERASLTPPEKWDLEKFERCNYVDAAAPVWRYALEASWSLLADDSCHEDHHMWRQLTAAGWVFQPAPELVLQYRLMPDSLTSQITSVGYAACYGYHIAPVTLFVPLSGRAWAWPAMQGWLKDLSDSKRGRDIRLVLCDTSGNTDFSEVVRREGLALPFADVRYYQQSVAAPGLADLERDAHNREVQTACTLIYNRMAQEATTHLVWVLEDDVLPEQPGELALWHLIEGLGPDVAAVSGIYPDRKTGRPVAWVGEARNRLQYITKRMLDSHPTGHLPIFGSGFGCLLARREVLRMIPQAVPSGEEWYDPRCFDEVRKLGLTAALAKAVVCSHRNAPSGVPSIKNPKVIALYLPGFHRDPINDRAWGDGWTEWDNLRKWSPTKPRHIIQRPHADIGEYDLMDAAVRRKQGELARKYGVHGFAVYHYWFGGTKALNRPWEQRLLDGEPNLPFHFIWANEPWSRIWDGSESQVIQPQTYGGREEWRSHAEYLRPFLEHPQYIRHGGRRVLGIYRPGKIPHLTERLRFYREVLGEDLHFTSLFGTFPNHQSPACSPEMDSAISFEPFATNCRGKITLLPHQRVFRGACPHWDNTPRRGSRGFQLKLESFASQLRSLMNEDTIYINAWNEWGEGAVLEPSDTKGYLLLKVLSDYVAGRGSWSR